METRTAIDDTIIVGINPEPAGARQATKPLRPQTDDDVSERILDIVRDRNLGPGDRLPTELALARLLGMSRQKVRSGLHHLESLGLIKSRQGSGRVLLDRSHHTLPGLLAPSLDHTPSDILDTLLVREALEVWFVAPAVGVISAESLAKMRTAVESMRRRVKEGRPYADADRAFHDALYVGLGNQLLSSLLSTFWDMFDGIDLDVLRHCEAADETLRHHQNILEAVQCREPAVAQFHMRRHFYDSVESLKDFVARARS